MSTMAFEGDAAALSAAMAMLPFADAIQVVATPTDEGWSLSGPDTIIAAIAATDVEAALAKGIKESLTAAVQAHVDATAKSRGYNDGASCASYAGSTVAAWAAEAVAFVAWRDAVWVSALASLAAVTAGTASVPTAAELIAGLPGIAWPVASGEI